MKTENLKKSCDTFDIFMAELSEAYTDAVNSENQFAEEVLYGALKSAKKLKYKLVKIKVAAGIVEGEKS